MTKDDFKKYLQKIIIKESEIDYVLNAWRNHPERLKEKLERIELELFQLRVVS